jgi:hypothetical protein
MSSPDSCPKAEQDRDELDCLARRALKTLMSGQEPPERVWKRIKLALEKDRSPPQRFPLPWLSLSMQPILTLLLVMLGGIGLQTLLNPVDIRNSSYDPPSLVVTVDIGDRSASSNPAVISEEHELYLLKTQHRLMARGDAESKDTPSEVPLIERQSPKVTSSSFLPPLPESKLLKGGPYEY